MNKPVLSTSNDNVTLDDMMLELQNNRPISPDSRIIVSIHNESGYIGTTYMVSPNVRFNYAERYFSDKFTTFRLNHIKDITIVKSRLQSETLFVQLFV